jgi:hypothetical protein
MIVVIASYFDVSSNVLKVFALGQVTQARRKLRRSGRCCWQKACSFSVESWNRVFFGLVFVAANAVYVLLRMFSELLKSAVVVVECKVTRNYSGE